MARQKSAQSKAAEAVTQQTVTGPEIKGPVVTIQTEKPGPIAVVPRNGPIVRPVVSAEDAATQWKEYIATCQAILDPNSDYVYMACGTKPDEKAVRPKAFRSREAAQAQLDIWKRQNYRNLYIKECKKRSAWDKLARFYGIDTPIESQALCTIAEVVQVGEHIIEKLQGDSFKIFVYQNAATLAAEKVTVLLRVVAPNGRTILGDGACGVSERYGGESSFAHADHDILATAFTRAFNRGVSRCIGTGEVSAEEFESVSEPDAPVTATAVNSAAISHAVSGGALEVSQVSEKTHKQDSSNANSGNGQDEGGRVPDSRSPNATPLADRAPLASPEPQAQPLSGPPKAEIPTLEQVSGPIPGEAKKPLPSRPAETEKASQPVRAGKFIPVREGTAFKDRLLSMKVFLFGSEKSEDRVLEYLFFSIPPRVAGPISIEYNGKWHPGKWNDAMAGKKIGEGADAKRDGSGLGDRAQRLTMMEDVLSEQGRDNFLKWARALVETAKANKIFR